MASNLFVSSTVSFADVAHQTLIFDKQHPADALILELLDTCWVQRLRGISQTGNTKLVYMYAEHSRFGHSLGTAYLASLLMKGLQQKKLAQVEEYQEAVATAALIHDIGHVAPGSHLAERIWAPNSQGQHEIITRRIIEKDQQISQILSRRGDLLPMQVRDILAGKNTVPPWTISIISGGGWNADRGNWAMVDSAMCAVSYGRYNVRALIDAFSLSPEGELLLQENRLDALTHFFVARDSMYRQVYQHRVLQAADALNASIVRRLRDILLEYGSSGCDDPGEAFNSLGIFADETMQAVIQSQEYGRELPLEQIFCMNESWWSYHLHRCCESKDKILADLACRLRDRRLFKTVRMSEASDGREENPSQLMQAAEAACRKLGFDPRYYLTLIDEQDRHRQKAEQLPMVALENGTILPLSEAEPLVDELRKRAAANRQWLALPQEVKSFLGRAR